MNDEENNALYQKYRELADAEEKVVFGGRLGTYKYYDMDRVIEAALMAAQKELNKKILEKAEGATEELNTDNLEA